MRRGMLLIELLGLLAIVGAMTLLFGITLRTTVGEVPKLQKVAQVSRVVSGMLARLQEDMDGAESLPGSYGGKEAGEKLLLIKLSPTVVSYEIGEGEIVREELGDGTSISVEGSYTWPVGKAKVSFHRWDSSGSTYAVEVQRAVEYRKQDITEDKLVNARVFNLGTIPGRQEKR